MSNTPTNPMLTADMLQPAVPLTQPLMMMQPQQLMPVTYVPVMSGLGGGAGFAGLQLGQVPQAAGAASPFQQAIYAAPQPGLVRMPLQIQAFSSAASSPATSPQLEAAVVKKPPYVVRPGAWVDGRNLIVTGLPVNTNEDALKSMFAPFGVVSRVHVVMDKDMGKSRGFGFVEYTDAEAAGLALKQSGALRPVATLDNPAPTPVVINYGRRSSEHRKSNSVYIGGFGKELGIAELLKLCKEFGEIRSGKVLDNRKHSDGVAFIRFASTDDADHACQALDGADVMCTSGKLCNLRVRLPDEVGKAVQRYGAVEKRAG